MADNVKEVIEKDQEAVQQKFTNPYDFLKTIPGAPSEEKIKEWKAQTPNQRIRVFSPDTKRVFLVRGISALELNNIQPKIPTNVSPEKAEQELYAMVASQCVVWTNANATQKLSLDDLRTGSAGLPSTLFQLIQYLSDFVEPEALNVLSAEL